MNFSGISTRRRIAAAAASCLFGGMAAATLVAPTASAAPDCSPAAIDGTVDSVTVAAQQYLVSHPGAGGVVSAAITQPRDVASANIRNYFTANPSEYYELRGILAPIGDTQRACNTTVLPPYLATAYNEFVAG
ncbi:heme-binding protein [Mycolicibacterium mengxianglii]|uniref:heme-binding protein n=1 Tax=Mycolicibacterium mengxianglii TaxID=2736649 RepID=UPI0018D19FFF|nr:heme-binding protein [Mycolicibacterium mengxianglii]